MGPYYPAGSYFADWHGGQASEEYRRLSGMGRYFRPRPGLSYDTLTENGRGIYDAAVATDGGYHAFLPTRRRPAHTSPAAAIAAATHDTLAGLQPDQEERRRHLDH